MFDEKDINFTENLELLKYFARNKTYERRKMRIIF